jgi:hypothetical protein
VGNFQQRATMLYRSDPGGVAPTINANGNSGGSSTGLGIDIHLISDLLLIVTIGGTPTGTTPTLVVGVDVSDAAGNWVPQVIKTGSLNASGQTVVSGGLHGITTNQLVLPAWCRVSWTLTGTTPVFPAVQISLFGR